MVVSPDVRDHEIIELFDFCGLLGHYTEPESLESAIQ